MEPARALAAIGAIGFMGYVAVRVLRDTATAEYQPSDAPENPDADAERAEQQGAEIPYMSTVEQRRAAFLMMIRYAEGTAGAEGYRMLFGGSLFDSFATHPRIYKPFINKRGESNRSSAAGAFQINWPTYMEFAPGLGITDFSPDSQDRIALEIIKRAGALGDVDAGNVEAAIAKVRKRWASLPGAGYAQPERSLAYLLDKYTKALG